MGGDNIDVKSGKFKFGSMKIKFENQVTLWMNQQALIGYDSNKIFKMIKVVMQKICDTNSKKPYPPIEQSVNEPVEKILMNVKLNEVQEEIYKQLIKKKPDVEIGENQKNIIPILMERLLLIYLIGHEHYPVENNELEIIKGIFKKIFKDNFEFNDEQIELCLNIVDKLVFIAHAHLLAIQKELGLIPDQVLIQTDFSDVLTNLQKKIEEYYDEDQQKVEIASRELSSALQFNSR